MTIDEFFAQLLNVCEHFEWRLVPDVSTIPEQRSRVRLRLRAAPGRNPSRPLMDPIGALCYSRTGRVHEPAAWSEAGEDLTLLPSDAAKIHAASNDRTWTGPKGSRKPLPEMVTLRVRLLESVGLAVVVPRRGSRQDHPQPAP
jgi:hypothetical protein